MNSTVAVAGGLGDLGRLIVDALRKTGKHDVYVLSRKIPNDTLEQTSPLTGKKFSPVIKADYSSEESLAQLLEQYQIHTVICAMAMDFEDASHAQLRLIRAADAASCVQRFIPSEFNVDYDLCDDILPYPEKRFHTVARRALETTSSLEYTYIYPGMFMDYFGMPHIETHLRPLPLIIEPAAGQAVVPGDGNAMVFMSYTKDVALYTALALQIEKWPRVLTVRSSGITLNRLVELVEENLGRKLQVTYEPVEERLLQHQTAMLPSSLEHSSHFPGGIEQLTALMADLGACMALGAYDFTGLKDSADLVEIFQAQTEAPPMRIERLLQLAWKGR
ncbi:hypothetical protein SEUCBS139899_004878 [Sporothrix eucalyptigena]